MARHICVYMRTNILRYLTFCVSNSESMGLPSSTLLVFLTVAQTTTNTCRCGTCISQARRETWLCDTTCSTATSHNLCRRWTICMSRLTTRQRGVLGNNKNTRIALANGVWVTLLMTWASLLTLLNPSSTVCYHIRLMSIQEMRACVVAKISNRKFIYWYARHIFTCLNNIIAFDRRAGCRAHLRGCNRATIWIVCDTHT